MGYIVCDEREKMKNAPYIKLHFNIRRIFLLVLIFIDCFQMIHSGSCIDKKRVQKSDGGHAFHHDDSSGHNDGVVAAFDGDADFLVIPVYGVLRGEDGGRRLYVGAQHDL